MIKGEYLLWYDNDPKQALEEKVKLVAGCYKQKFGWEPNIIYVHPSMVKKPVRMGTVLVKPLFTVLKGHFMIGREDDPT